MTNIAREILFETSSEVVDAATFLSLAHGELMALFGEYESIQAIAEKQKVAEKIFRSLRLNMQLEEEVFFPAIKRAVKESGLLSLAAMSHSLLRYLLTEISCLDTDTVIYDIKLRVLGDHVKHYIKEMHTKLARVNLSQKIDVWHLGGQLALRKEDLCC